MSGDETLLSGGSGEATPPTPPPAPNSDPAPAPDPTPVTPPAGADDPGNGPVKEPKSTRTLLDDDDPPKDDDATPPPDDEAVSKFIGGIEAVDLGDGVQWSDDTLRAIAPSLMELTGGDAAKANGLVKAYATHMQKQARKQNEAMEAFNEGLISECKTRFGEDLKKVAQLARAGGRAIFGDVLWDALKSTPAFANNPDVLERLATHGRRVREDTGAVKPTAAAPREEEDLFRRMYRGVK